MGRESSGFEALVSDHPSYLTGTASHHPHLPGPTDHRRHRQQERAQV